MNCTYPTATGPCNQPQDHYVHELCGAHDNEVDDCHEYSAPTKPGYVLPPEILENHGQGYRCDDCGDDVTDDQYETIGPICPSCLSLRPSLKLRSVINNETAHYSPPWEGALPTQIAGEINVHGASAISPPYPMAKDDEVGERYCGDCGRQRNNPRHEACLASCDSDCGHHAFHNVLIPRPSPTLVNGVEFYKELAWKYALEVQALRHEVRQLREKDR